MIRPRRHPLKTRLRSAIDASPLARHLRPPKPPASGEPADAFAIRLPDLTGKGLRPVYLERNARYATATSVKLLDRETLVCASFLEKKLYLIRFDFERRTHRILDEIATTFRGVPVETDLADADPDGVNVILSNFHHGSFTQYRRNGDRLALVSDLDFDLEGARDANWVPKVHGVKYLNRDCVAGAVSTGPTGVRIFDLVRNKSTLHIPLSRKTQDMSFLSNREMLVLTVSGAPTRERRTPYSSEVTRIAFDLERQTCEVGPTRVYPDTHFDASVIHDDRLYLTDQRNHCVRVLDVDSFETLHRIDGYHFPHGIDIECGLLAVTNYGWNTIDLRAVDTIVTSVTSATSQDEQP